MIYGYARVSTVDQNLDRQKDALLKYGVDHLFCEKISGAKKSRPELDRMLSLLERGDSVVIESLSRLGRSSRGKLGGRPKTDITALKKTVALYRTGQYHTA